MLAIVIGVRSDLRHAVRLRTAWLFRHFFPAAGAAIKSTDRVDRGIGVVVRNARTWSHWQPRWRCRRNYPSRDGIVFSAFIVVLGTLIVQGLTIRPLISPAAHRP